MKKLYIPLIVFIGLGINLTAQEKSRKEKKGDKYVFSYSYDKAIDAYTQAKPLSIDGQRKLAESYHKMGQNTESEVVYSKLVTESGVLPEDFFNYAMILKSNGKYDEAHKNLDKFAELKPTDLRAKDYLANKAEFANLLKDDGKYKLVLLDVNTDAQDFGTSYYKNGIVFTSTRAKVKMIKRSYNGNGKPFLNMYVSEVDGSQLKKPEIFDKDFNGKMHDGPASFNKEGTYMAFTRNNARDKSKDKVVELQIFISSYKDNEWTKAEPFVLNNEAYSVGHPCLSADGKTMYFVTDMPGGYGGTDIYKTTKNEKEEWGKAENLGDKVNTEGDELFPFFEENNRTLLFSSNGRFGLGGQDVFISKMSGSGFSQAVNAGAPLNTQFDDFAAIADGKTNKGYFSSNRAGGKGDDDIYTVDFLKGLDAAKRIEGFAKDINGNAVPTTFITLLDEKGKMIDTLTTKADAAFVFYVDTDKNFKLTGKKESYEEGDTLTNTFGKEAIVKADVIMLKKEEVIAKKIIVGADLAKIVEFNPVYFDLDKANIRPDAEAELKKIIKVMNQYPNMTVELGSYTDCRETKDYNQILSDKRAKNSTDYIKAGITTPERISGKGYGEKSLTNDCACDGVVVSDCPEDDHQKNRRTEFIITKK
jgi:outer membrane protein OmpA-like peptidoglycan-associated protein/tetratricopeptide (TPR) repeat protein